MAEIDRLANLKTIRYDLDIKVDYDMEKIFGQCRIVIHNAGPSIFSTIPLLLYRLLRVTSIADSQGESIPFTQEIAAFGDWEKLQVNLVQVTLNTSLRSGEDEALTVDYQGYILGYAETGMSYVRETINKDFTILRPDSWAYPEVGLPNWKAYRRMGMQNYRYRLNVTVPDSLTVANGGRLVRVTRANGWATFSYENIKLAWRMDAAIAAYSILEEGPFKIFHFKEDANGAATILSTLKSTIDLYSRWFGPPEKIEGFVVIEVPDGYGSQADVTSILQTHAAFQKQDQMYQFYHEVSHIFDVRCTDPLPARFESEGMASFLQDLVQEKREGSTGSLKKGLDRALNSLKKEFTEDPKKMAVPMADYGKEDMTGLSYTKGMVFFALLHELLGEEKFFGTMRSFYRKYRGIGATTADFVDHLKAECGPDLEPFIEDWIKGTQSSQWIADDLTYEDILKKHISTKRIS